MKEDVGGDGLYDRSKGGGARKSNVTKPPDHSSCGPRRQDVYLQIFWEVTSGYGEGSTRKHKSALRVKGMTWGGWTDSHLSPI